MKAFLAPKVRKSIPESTFTFGKSDFLGLVNLDFLDLAKFIMVDRFLIFPPIPTPSTLSITPSTS